MSLPPRSNTPVGEQSVDPQLLQSMLVALTNLQMQIANQSGQTSRDPKVPDVQMFNGNKSQYSLFLARLQNFFSMQPSSYNSDSKRIGYVISRLEGPAADWAVTLLENQSVGNNLETLNDWNVFLNSFSKFSDPFSRRNATDLLLSLTQGKSQSVLNYWTKFSELLYRSDISPDSARPLFERGLKYEIRERLVDKDLSSDLDEFVMAVVDLDNRLYRLRQDRKFFNNSGQHFGNNGNTPSRMPQPMEIGNLNFPEEVNINGVNLSNGKERLDEIRALDPDIRRKICVEEHRCHYCKRVVGNPPVHVAQTCPFKANKTKADYFCVIPEVLPQKGVPDNVKDGIPQRQDLRINFINEKKTKLLMVEALVDFKDTCIILDALVDSGAMGMGFIDRALVVKEGIPCTKMNTPIKVTSVDGTACGSGVITESVRVNLKIQGQNQALDLLVIDCPNTSLILGLGWLKTFNPTINWNSGILRLPKGPIIENRGQVPLRQVLNVNLTETYIQEIFDNFSEVFTDREFPDLPPRRLGVDMDIELNDEKVPPFGPIYSLSKSEEESLRKYLEETKKVGIIRESKSPAGSPVMFVPKPDGSLRLCVDYRALNAVTKSNRAALPIIKDCLRRAGGCKFFSKIDLKSAFHLIRIKEGKEYLTAFRTKYGHFEYLVMPFGLKNAPGTFQAFMNNIFGDLIDRGVIVYIDDILIYTKDLDSHKIILREVFSRIQKFNLTVKREKCIFFANRVAFLGHILSEQGVGMDPKKLEAIENWKFPKNRKEVRSFIGLANYYRDFIENFSAIARPLTDLTKEGVLFCMDKESMESFLKLKDSFKNEVLLMYPDQTKEFFLEVDASEFGIGAALSQVDEKTGKLRPIGFYSRKLLPQEQNYEIHDKELLAIVEGLKEWRYLLIGTDSPFSVFSDHKNLLYFSEPRVLNRRQARWSLFLSDFNFNIFYRPGPKQVVSDALSRHPMVGPTEEDKLHNKQVLLRKDLFSVSPVDTISVAPALITPFENSDSEVESSNSDYDLNTYQSVENISEIDSNDSTLLGDLNQFLEFEQGPSEENADPISFQYVLQYLWKGEIPLVLSPRLIGNIKRYSKLFLFKNDRLYKSVSRNNQIYHTYYVPVTERKSLIKNYHLTLGHMQTSTLLPLLEVRYFWPTMKRDIDLYQSRCHQCHLNAPIQQTHLRPLQPHDPVGLPFVKWGIDFIHGLPETPEGYKNIFSAKCYATKRVILIKTKDRTARTAAQCIFEGIVCKFGVPLEIVCDRASAFLDEVLQEYLRLLGIHQLPTAAFTPRSNGSVERAHRDLKQLLRKLCDGDIIKWTHYISQAELTLNVRIHEATGFSPFYLSHGIEARLPADVIPPVPPGSYDLNNEGDVAILSSQELAALGQNRAAALMRLRAQAARMKQRYDKQVGIIESSFQIGDVVKLKRNDPSLHHAYRGPFFIVDQGPNQTYFLQRPDGRRWVDVTGNDTPVNPDHLEYYTAIDPEYYDDEG